MMDWASIIEVVKLATGMPGIFTGDAKRWQVE
jgi:hypothetical protein